MIKSLRNKLIVMSALILLALVMLLVQNVTKAPNPEAAKADGRLEALALNNNYSFKTDTDNDGLSDANEFILGTDPSNPDTDNDTYKDGAEVTNGYDPSVPGKARLSERPNLNLTVKYFIWATKEKGLADPQLDDVLVNQFLDTQGLTKFTLPLAKASEIETTVATQSAVQNYLKTMSEISLPQEVQSYATLAADALAGKAENTARQIASDIAAVREKFTKIATPPQALEVQKQYLATLSVLEELFSDIAGARKDPVRIALNQKKGEWLVVELNRLETLKQNLVNSL